jgi:hypothetical protein
MFEGAQTALGWRGLMHEPASFRLRTTRAPIMKIQSIVASSGTSNFGVIPQILGAIVLALALTGTTLLITNFVFDLIGYG